MDSPLRAALTQEVRSLFDQGALSLPTLDPGNFANVPRQSHSGILLGMYMQNMGSESSDSEQSAPPDQETVVSGPPDSLAHIALDHLTEMLKYFSSAFGGGVVTIGPVSSGGGGGPGGPGGGAATAIAAQQEPPGGLPLFGEANQTNGTNVSGENAEMDA